jgi:hypothetical protein
MKGKYYFIMPVIIVLLFGTGCNTNSGNNKSIADSTHIQRQTDITARFNSVSNQLQLHGQLITQDLVSMKIIDTSLTPSLNEVCYCDTTIQLNDSVYYAIINANDRQGLCSFFYLTTLNKKSKQVVASRYLYSECDVDYSRGKYELYDMKIMSKSRIRITRTSITNKKNETSGSRKETADHDLAQISYLTISPDGKISVRIQTEK